ncbi:MAG: hypothetical protein BWY19_01020 [bacterium ADurb.Bin212]|nr:MAG: hypothetical protein BWY19_01020 [bacterium ADurb.Bin212]
MNKSSNITDKQQEILKLLYRFRFLKRSQIQQLLNHKDYKTINLWLKDLIEKEYIQKRDIKFPYKIAYHLALSGISYFKKELKLDAKLLQKYYREQDRSLSFISSCLLIADIFLDLQNRSNQNVNFKVYTKSDYSSHEYGDLLLTLKPHIFITQITANKTKEYFVEIIGFQPKERLRQRIKNYLYFYQGMEWQEETDKDFPTTLIIYPNDEVLDYIKSYTKRKLYQFDETRPIIQLTTREQVNQAGITGDVWKEI